MSDKENTNLHYDSDKKVSSKGTSILGRLYGPVADIINATRNGRKYPESLWEKVFDDPIVKEQFECGGLFGEMNHPADREETDLTQVCVCMPEKPTKKDGKLWASFDILDTPNGRILKTLCDYGYKIGISSRGSGETYKDAYGNPVVDEDTFQLFGWDIVLIPAVKSARLKYVTESLSHAHNDETLDDKIEISDGLRIALTESLKNSNEQERGIMLDTISTLKLDYSVNKFNDVNILAEDFSNSVTAANGGDKTFEDLKRVIKENRDLQNQIAELQEKLSVCYTKDTKSDECLDDVRRELAFAQESLDSERKKTASLSEQLKEKEKLISRYQGAYEKSTKINSTLTEGISAKDVKIQELTEKLNSATSKLAEIGAKDSEQVKKLKESYNELSADSKIMRTELESKLSEANQKSERNRKIAQAAVDRYIMVRASMLGVSPSDIKGRLHENYSFNDIDKVCDSLKTYRLNMESLPFTAQSGKVSMKITESKSLSANHNVASSVDDTVDTTLMSLAKLNK